MPKLHLAVSGLAALLVAAGCSGGTPTPKPTATAEPAPPTPIARVRVTPTVAVDPLDPIDADSLPGVVVPAGAKLTEFIPATEDTDAHADYRMDDIDGETVYQWFLDEMPELGWDDGEDLDGALQFTHTDELSRRHAREGFKRTALVLLDETNGGVDITVIVEEPEERP